MKNLIVYSSLTGNTKKVAEACKSIANEEWDILAVNQDIDVDKYDTITLGFWVDKGTADQKSLELIKKIKNKRIAFFATLGAYPDSDHAMKTLDRVETLFKENGNEVHSSFICQGAIDPKLIDWMRKLPNEHPHSPNEDRIKRWEEASKHPNEKDFADAKAWFEKVLDWSR